MKTRLALTAAVTMVGVLALPSSAATKTLDGKKVKKLTFNSAGTTQVHDDEFVTGQAGLSPARESCAAPRCYRYSFVWKPAKGVHGDVLVKISWTAPVDDMDLYLVDKDNAQLATCGSFAGTSEYLVAPADTFKKGQKYTVIADFYRVTQDSVAGEISMPTSEEPPTGTIGIFNSECGGLPSV